MTKKMTNNEQLELRSHIAELHKAGATISQMSKTLNVTRDQILFQRQKMDIKKTNRIDETVRKQVFDMKKQGLSRKTISEKLKLHPSTITNITKNGERYSFDEILKKPVNRLLSMSWKAPVNVDFS